MSWIDPMHSSSILRTVCGSREPSSSTITSCAGSVCAATLRRHSSSNVRNVEYYAVKPRVPKWLGGMFGGVFLLLNVLSAWLIVDLTRRAHAAAALSAAPAPVAASPALAALAVAASPTPAPARRRVA